MDLIWQKKQTHEYCKHGEYELFASPRAYKVNHKGETIMFGDAEHINHARYQAEMNWRQNENKK